MIAKLIAWAPSREEAIARMARALREYQVLGIRTTIPFFLWLMQQPEYRAGQFDTTYLDRLLEARRGRSFSEITADDEDLIAIATSVDAHLRANAAGNGAAAGGSGDRMSAWQRAARLESLRS
jgi:acetyl-CoA carboxylase biotin carboxylase subunit